MAITCPRDGSELVEVDRSGVKIDGCRTCRGIWLDRGELEKLLTAESRDVQQDEREDEAFLRDITGDGGRHQPAAESSSSSSSGGPKLDLKTAERIFSEYQRHKHHRKKPKSKLHMLAELMG